MFRAFLAHHQEILYCLVSRSLWQTVIQSIICRHLHSIGKPELVAVLLHYLCMCCGIVMSLVRLCFMLRYALGKVKET
jgi:hypothetical protein